MKPSQALTILAALLISVMLVVDHSELVRAYSILVVLYLAIFAVRLERIGL